MPRRPSLFAHGLNLALFGAVLGPEARRAPPRNPDAAPQSDGTRRFRRPPTPARG